MQGYEQDKMQKSCFTFDGSL